MDNLLSKLKPVHFILIMVATVLVTAFSSLKGDRVNEIDAGSVMSLEETATSWNDRPRTRIETDKGVFNVRGVVSAMKGVAATVVTYESGQRRLCLSDREKCLRVVGRQ